MRVALWSIIGASLVSSLHSNFRSLLELDEQNFVSSSSPLPSSSSASVSSSLSSAISPSSFSSSDSISTSVPLISSSSSSKAAHSSSLSSIAIRSTDDDIPSSTPGDSKVKKVSTWGQRWNPAVQRVFQKAKVEEEEDGDSEAKATSSASIQSPSISSIQARYSNLQKTEPSGQKDDVHADLMRKSVDAAKIFWKTIHTTAGTEIVPSINTLGQKLSAATSAVSGQKQVTQKTTDQGETAEVVEDLEADSTRKAVEKEDKNAVTKTVKAVEENESPQDNDEQLSEPTSSKLAQKQGSQKSTDHDETEEATESDSTKNVVEQEEDEDTKEQGKTEEKRLLQGRNGEVSSETREVIQGEDGSSTLRAIPQSQPIAQGKKGKNPKRAQTKKSEEAPLPTDTKNSFDSPIESDNNNERANQRRSSANPEPTSLRNEPLTTDVTPARFGSVSSFPSESPLNSASLIDSSSGSGSIAQPSSSSASSSTNSSSKSPASSLVNSLSDAAAASSSSISSLLNASKSSLSALASSVSDTASSVSDTASSLVSSVLNTSVAKAVLPPRAQEQLSSTAVLPSSEPLTASSVSSPIVPSSTSTSSKSGDGKISLTPVQFKMEEENDDESEGSVVKPSSAAAESTNIYEVGGDDPLFLSTSLASSPTTTATGWKGKHAGIKVSADTKSSSIVETEGSEPRDNTVDTTNTNNQGGGNELFTPTPATFSLSSPFSSDVDTTPTKPLPPIISEPNPTNDNTSPSSSLTSSPDSMFLNSVKSNASKINKNSDRAVGGEMKAIRSEVDEERKKPANANSETKIDGEMADGDKEAVTSPSSIANVDENNGKADIASSLSSTRVDKTEKVVDSLFETVNSTTTAVKSVLDKSVKSALDKSATTVKSALDSLVPTDKSTTATIDNSATTDSLPPRTDPLADDYASETPQAAAETNAASQPGAYVAVRMNVVFKPSVLDLDLKPPHLWEMLNAGFASALNVPANRFEMSQFSDSRHVEFLIVPTHSSSAGSAQLGEQLSALIKGEDVPEGILTHIESIEKAEVVPPCEDGSFSKVCAPRLETTKGSNWMYYMGGLVMIGAVGLFVRQQRRDSGMTKTVHGAKFARVKSEDDDMPPRVSSAGETSSEFVERVLSKLGIPTYGMAKYTNMLKDKHLHTLEQLKAMDDADWRAVGLPPVIETGLKEALTSRGGISSREARSGGMELTRPKPALRMDRYEDKSRMPAPIDTDAPTDAWDLDMPDEDMSSSPVAPVKDYVTSKKSTVVIPEAKEPEAPSADSELTSDKPVVPKARPKSKIIPNSKPTKPVQKKAVSEVQGEGDGWNMDMDDF